MNNCPVELILKIFSYACTDGGRTGCALSLVSRWIHAVATPVRFQTVSLTGLSQMRLFINALEALPAPPRVSHLLLSDNGIADSESEKPDRCAQWETVCGSIVSTLCGSLISLMADLRSAGVTTAGLIRADSNFPLLQDLSIACTIERLSMTFPPTPPLMPNLRRLHLFSNASEISRIRSFISGSPQITHIRLSNSPDEAWLVQFLEAALRKESEILRLPGGLKQLIVQPAESPYNLNAYYGTMMMRFFNVRDKFKDFETRHEIVALTPECYYRAEDAMEDWLDIVAGGDGCWCMPPRKTTSSVRNEVLKAEQGRMAACADGADFDKTVYVVSGAADV
jgi:hypothetical protein